MDYTPSSFYMDLKTTVLYFLKQYLLIKTINYNTLSVYNFSDLGLSINTLTNSQNIDHSSLHTQFTSFVLCIINYFIDLRNIWFLISHILYFKSKITIGEANVVFKFSYLKMEINYDIHFLSAFCGGSVSFSFLRCFWVLYIDFYSPSNKI